MKAIVWTKYGSPAGLQLQEIEKPIPQENEVLIKIHATTVTAGDCELRRSNQFTLFWLPLRIYFGFFKPRNGSILGQELAGVIEAVGKEVTRFRPGDAVFAAAGFSLGTYAAYKCLPENGILAIKPDNMTFEEAATIPLEGLEALDFLRQGKIQPGEKVLINGAGGSIGTLAIQIAKLSGAEVTGVDHSDKLDLLRSLGCAHVIDYTREDFTKRIESYDVIFDVIGKSSFGGSLKSLRVNGRYLLGNPGLLQRLQGSWTSRFTDKQVFLGTRQRREDLLFLRQLIENGRLHAVVDRKYPLEQVAEAHRYVETGQKKGSVVITVNHPEVVRD